MSDAAPRLALFVVLAVSACTRPPESESGSSASTGKGDAVACGPKALGLLGATPVSFWRAPAGCRLAPKPGPPTVVHGEDELAALLSCPTPTPSGVDFERQVLVVTQRMLSPASVGTDVLDDGRRVTFVNKQRSPCEGDPLPMPITVPLAFVVAKGADRTFGEASCNVESRCP